MKSDNRHLNAPPYRDVFVLHDGTVIVCGPREAQRTLDRRSEGSPVETVWELRLQSGVVRRVWPNELREWRREDITGKKEGELQRQGEDAQVDVEAIARAEAERQAAFAQAEQAEREQSAEWIKRRLGDKPQFGDRNSVDVDAGVQGEEWLRQIREAQQRSRGQR